MNSPLSTRENVGVPQELLRSTPRDVRLTPAGGAVWFLVVLLGFGAIIGGTLVYSAATRWSSLKSEMRADANVVEGQVIGLRKSGDDNSQRLVTYQYTVAGREYQNQMRLRLRRTSKLVIGSTVNIHYLPRDPGVGWLEGFEPSGVPIFLVPLTVIASGLLILVLIWNLRDQRELLTVGRPALATVTQVQKTQKGDHRVVRIQYEFRILSGAMRTGKIDVHRNAPPAGSTIVILYDADNESRQRRYPFSLYRLEGTTSETQWSASNRRRKRFSHVA